MKNAIYNFFFFIKLSLKDRNIFEIISEKKMTSSRGFSREPARGFVPESQVFQAIPCAGSGVHERGIPQ